jgi:hypothetical protein
VRGFRQRISVPKIQAKLLASPPDVHKESDDRLIYSYKKACDVFSYIFEETGYFIDELL